MTIDDAALVTRESYFEDLAALRAARFDQGSVEWPLLPASVGDGLRRSGHRVVGLGGSACVARFVAETLIAGIAQGDARHVELDDLAGISDGRRSQLVFVSASGANRSMALAIGRAARNGARPVLVTLDPASRCARGIEVGNGIVLAPSESVYRAEFLATRNLAALVWLAVHAFEGRAVAARAMRALQEAAAREAGVAPAPLRRVTRIVVVFDAAGRTGAIDFTTRCAELGRYPVTTLSFSSLVHGSYNSLRPCGDRDFPWVVSFVDRKRARELSALVSDGKVPGLWSVVPINGYGIVSQVRSLGDSIALHHRFFEASSSPGWRLEPTALGIALWARFR